MKSRKFEATGMRPPQKPRTSQDLEKNWDIKGGTDIFGETWTIVVEVECAGAGCCLGSVSSQNFMPPLLGVFCKPKTELTKRVSSSKAG